MMIRRLIKIIVCLLIILLTFEVSGQKKYQFFQIPGRVKMDKGEPTGSVVNVLNLESNKIEKSITISSLGKFDIQLNFQTEYKLSVSKEGYYTKDILISTLIPQNIWEKDSVFPPFYIVVTLFKKVTDTPLSFEGKTIGKVSYSPNGTLDNFDSQVYIDDKDIKEEIDLISNGLGENDFNQKLAIALDFEKNNDLKSAYFAYIDASKLKPNDKFVKEKLKELASDLKDLTNELKTEKEFNRLIALSDANVINKKYPVAIDNFKGALDIKPNDAIATAKLANAEQLLAKVNADKAKVEEEFNRLLASGDNNVSKQLYSEAIDNYNGALKLKPNDSGAIAKLASTEKLLARANADKSKNEVEFNRLLAVGDKNVTNQKYPEAIENFKGALSIKPNDATATAKLAGAEQLLAKVNADKAKVEEEFNRLVASGDNNVSKQLYPEAIDNYNDALKLKPNDSGAIAKLAAAEKLLARANADKSKNEVEFNRLVAVGDKNVTNQKYPEAIENFKGALSIKPNDATATAKLASAEQLLAKVNADKAKVEEDFNRLVASGDNNVSKQLYPEAIDNFNGALKLKPNDSGAIAKLAAAEKLLARANADKSKNEVEFNRLVAVGDKNVTNQKYPEAIENFKGALSIKPNDATATAKLASAEQLLAKVNADKTKVEEDFNRLLASGDDNVKVVKYIEALTDYKEALQIKRGNEIVIAKIAEVQKLVQQKEAEKQAFDDKQRIYKQTIDRADKLFTDKIYPGAKEQYKQALIIDKSAVYPGNKIAEIDSILAAQIAAVAYKREQEAKRLQTFNDWVKNGDENYILKKWTESLTAYTKASEIIQENIYVKGKIIEVQNLIAKEGALAKFYQETMLLGANYFNNKQYKESLTAYKDARKLKPKESLPQQKILEIQSILEDLAAKDLADQKLAEAKKLSANDDAYQENIKKGDENFQKTQWTVSRFYYIEALKSKPNDNYAIGKIEVCDKMTNANITAEKMQEYKSRIAKGDTENNLKNYTGARFYYRNALEIIPWESYPQNKLKEIDQIFAEKLSQADQLLFKENLQKADDAFTKKEFPVARFYYNKANEINQEEYVGSKLKEIEGIVSGSEAKKINADYADCIKRADEAFQQKNLSIARFYYQKAITLKPDESYSKDQLKKISVGN